MDKRSSPRYEISLDALVHPAIGRSWRCAIQDFCAHGMLLAELQAHERRGSSPGIEAGAMVGIHFTIPGKPRDQHFRLEGCIVRVMDSGVGIKFEGGLSEEVLTGLLAHANRQIKPRAVIPTKKNGRQQFGVGPAANAMPEGSATALAQPAAQTTPGSALAGAQLAKVSRVARLDAEAGAARDRPEWPLTPAVRLPGPITPAESERLILAIRKVVAAVLPEMHSAFFDYMDNELLLLARDAMSNSVQSEYFEAMSILEKAKESVGEVFIHGVLDQIDNPRRLEALRDERKLADLARERKPVANTPLSLVDTDDFEDWLAIANIISRGERTYGHYLQDFRARLGMVEESWGQKEANPLGVATFCHAFNQAIHPVGLNKEIRQKVYMGFEAKAVPLLRRLYIEATKILEDSQLFLDIDEVTIASPAVNDSVIAASPHETESIAPSSPNTQAGTAAAVKDDQQGSAVGLPRQADPLDRTDSSMVHEIRADLEALRSELWHQREQITPDLNVVEVAQDRRATVDRRQESRSEDSRALGDIYQAMRSLVNQPTATQGMAVEHAENEVDKQEVQQLLRSLNPLSQPGPRINLRQQLLATAAADGIERRLAPQAAQSLDVVENLVGTMEQDALVSHSAKGWIRQLELTLGKVASGQEDLLDEAHPHQALEVINQLARLGGAESGNMRVEVDQIVAQIADDFDRDPKVFDVALNRLAPLISRNAKSFAGNVQRAVKTSEGRQTLFNAQRAVVSEVDQRLSGGRIPEVLMNLLMPGWRNLMVNTYLRQGQQSSAWQSQIQTLDQLVHHLGGKVNTEGDENYLAPEALLEQIEQGLDSISFDPGKRGPLIKSLRDLIIDRRGLEQMSLIESPLDSVAETLGFGGVMMRDERRKQLLAEGGSRRDWRRCLERAGHLHIGEWLAFLDQPEENRIAIVAWVNADASNFVLVNRRGFKTHELVVEELAKNFLDGVAVVLQEADIPLSDRASHQMLQNMHNQLTHQAAHDGVTGLANRKEFERALMQALDTAKRDGVEQLVAYFDLDQFKVINNAVGHDIGDKLLAEVGGVLSKALSGKACTLARLGGDEFGLLIANGEQVNGLKLVKQLCKAIKDYQFVWQKSVFRLSASCGVMFVDQDVESVQSILQCADAACFAAKDAGRDRILVYKAGDSEMAHRRDVMDFVSQIDKALEENRFVLNCQLITPIDLDAGEHAHYEILLTVLDDNDQPMPPQDFIIAAETYNRMGAIDRWVIRNAFDFIAKNLVHFEALGAFSINISGNSLAEEDFVEFVLAQIKTSGVPTSKICFEITETSAVGSLDNAIKFIEELRLVGVKFSLDDFGTGLSSYSYLRSLPVDFLKIDGVFVKDLQTNPGDYAVVKSINEIGHFMGKRTIAEYVENEEILTILREIGVDFAQGFGVGRKIPLTALLPAELGSTYSRSTRK